MARWLFGLDSSVIRDGTYTDLHRGQQVRFPVALGLESWEPAPEIQVAALQVGAARVEANQYDIVARVEAVGESAWVLDCGLLVGCPGRPPQSLDVGRWITGRVRLVLSAHPSELQAPGMPLLARTWFVERVHHRTEADDLGLPDLGLVGMGLHGGPEEAGWEELAFTDAWGDDDGRAEYLVECLPVDH